MTPQPRSASISPFSARRTASQLLVANSLMAREAGERPGLEDAHPAPVARTITLSVIALSDIIIQRGKPERAGRAGRMNLMTAGYTNTHRPISLGVIGRVDRGRRSAAEPAEAQPVVFMAQLLAEREEVVHGHADGLPEILDARARVPLTQCPQQRCPLVSANARAGRSKIRSSGSALLLTRWVMKRPSQATKPTADRRTCLCRRVCVGKRIENLQSLELPEVAVVGPQSGHSVLE